MQCEFMHMTMKVPHKNGVCQCVWVHVCGGCLRQSSGMDYALVWSHNGTALI